MILEALVILQYDHTGNRRSEIEDGLFDAKLIARKPVGTMRDDTIQAGSRRERVNHFGRELATLTSDSRVFTPMSSNLADATRLLWSASQGKQTVEVSA
jgi:hypothetical protein